MYSWYKGIISMLFILFIFSGCSNDDPDNVNVDGQEVENNKIEENDENDEQTSEKIDNIFEQVQSVVIPTSLLEMKEQQGGLMLNGRSLQDELEVDMAEFLLGMESELKSHIESLTSETQNPSELEKALIYILGTPNYQEVLELAEGFEPEFEEPYLPYPGKTVEEIKQEPNSDKSIILLDASSKYVIIGRW
ncbi:hypothetical protein ACFSTA_04975 [Ornithinibacillus salinisoli]|uniref:Uncharacterized protein n=1 Tax=Ornithinibacillus salinisoli TaxID=1848459 RepID=A0ABW4VYP8_9BACI